MVDNLQYERIALHTSYWWWAFFAQKFPWEFRPISPKETNGIATFAMVVYDEKRLTTKFVFDPERMREHIPIEIQRVGVIMHEILHISRLHLVGCTRFLKKFPRTQENMLKINMAQDIEINQYIPSEFCSNGMLTHQKFGFKEKLPWEQYYLLLDELVKTKRIVIKLKNPPNGQGGQNKNKEDGKGEKDQEITMGEGDQTVEVEWTYTGGISEQDLNELDEAVQEYIRADTISKIKQSEESCRSEKMQGKIPGCVEQTLEEFSKPPEIPWNEKMRMFPTLCGNMLLGVNRKLKDKRYGLRPSMYPRPNTRLLIGIDTSGSISEEQLAAFINEINGIYKAGECEMTLAQIDYSIQKVEDYYVGLSKKIKIHGRGGTSFKPITKLLQGSRYDGVIYFTDLYGSFPDTTPSLPFLWIATQDADNNDPPFGVIARMKNV